MKKIITFKEIVINKALKEIENIFSSLDEDDISIFLQKSELLIILSEFYDYYQKKDIVSRFLEMIIGHFEDIVLMAQDEEEDITYSFVLQKLQLLELIDSPLEVSPNDTKRIVNQLYKKFDGDD